jgi:hypothetical protein
MSFHVCKEGARWPRQRGKTSRRAVAVTAAPVLRSGLPLFPRDPAAAITCTARARMVVTALDAAASQPLALHGAFLAETT